MLSDVLVEVLFDPTWGPVGIVVAVLALARALDSLSFLLEPTMACLGRPKLQFYVSLANVISLVLLLAFFGRFSLHAAVYAVLLNAAVFSVASLALMLWVTRIPLTAFARAMTPGIVLTAMCVGAIAALDPARGALDPIWGLVVTGAALVLLWLCFVGTMLQRRFLVLPTP